jgi:hypothetical protein
VQTQWGGKWWNYDLPPGWKDLCDQPLEYVCAEQWRASHEATLATLAAHPDLAQDSLRVRFEDLVDGVKSRAAVERVVQWLGVTADAPLLQTTPGQLPPIMATDKPRNRRWFEKADLLEPVLATTPVRQMMERLGYDLKPELWT